MKQVGFEIIFKLKDGSLQKVNKELDSTNAKSAQFKEQTKELNKQSSAFGSSLSKATLGLGAFGLAAQGLSTLKDVFATPIKEAIALNSQYEQLNHSIASLISINHDNITTTGQSLSAQEKWQLSLEASKQTIDELKESGLELGYSVGDMSDMFKGFYSTAGSSMSLDQAKSAMKAIAAAANVSGVSVDSLKVTLDSLGSGIAQTSTDFGRFVSAMGLSTEAMQQAKREGKLYEVIMEKLSPLSESAAFSANSYAVNMSKLNSVLDEIKQSAFLSYFESMKQSLASLTQFLSTHKDTIISVFSRILDTITTLLSTLYEASMMIKDVFMGAINDIAQAFGYSASEGDILLGVIKSLQSAAVILGSIFKMVQNTLSLLINSLRLLINSAQVAYHAMARVFSFGEDDKHHKAQIERLTNKDKELKAAMMSNIKGYGEIFEQGIEKIQDIWKDKAKEGLESKQTTQMLKGKIGTNAAKKQGTAKERERDTLRSYFDNEFAIREKHISLMKEGKQKELELETLRYERTITHLNLELRQKVQSGQISIEQANRLYEVELKIHEQKMHHIKEYSKTYEDLKSNINSALDENINNALNGKFTRLSNFGEDLFSSMQSSITKGFATSISAAFMESSVIESMNKSLASAIDGLGSNGAIGGIMGRVTGLQIGESSLAEVAGNALAGFGIGSAAGGLVGNFLSDKENAAKTQKSAQSGAAGGAVAGAAIGSFVPVIGTAVGALVGGLVGGIGGALIGSFSSKKLTTKAKGVELTQKATKEVANAREFADMHESSKKYWGIKKSSKSWTEYYSASNIALRGIRESIRSYEYLLQDIGGGIKELSISAGRYKDYDEILNTGAKELIKSFFEAPSKALKENAPTPHIDEIYKVWEEYAKSVDKQVSEALSESLNAFVELGQNFQSWLYTYKGEESEAARYAAELAALQVERVQESLGASDINIDNYLSYREEALKKNFDPYTIEQINALGEALMQSADASKKYEEALKGENKTKLNLIDPFLEKTKKLEETNTQEKDTNEKLQVAMLSTLKQMLRVSQESLEAGVQK